MTRRTGPAIGNTDGCLPRRVVYRPLARPPRRVLIIKPCCFGDVLMATPALAAVRRAWPQAQIDWLIGSWAQPAIAHTPRLPGLLPGDPLGTAPARQAIPAAIRLAGRLRGRYDAALVLDRSPVLAALP